MKTGTRSLLFGVHQFLYHPVTVWLAWLRLYGARPTWREALCILVHDWGYWGCPEMDGHQGREHPMLGAAIVGRLLGDEYADLVRYHSRTLAKLHGEWPSKLAWPDKLHLLYYPRRFYLFLARLSGELAEYRREAASYTDKCPLSATDEQWFEWVKAHLREVAERGAVRGVA